MSVSHSMIEEYALPGTFVDGAMALQPIVQLTDSCNAFAYEALFRPTMGNVETAIALARQKNQLFHFDYQCRQMAMQAASHRLSKNPDALLFVNICPETILDIDHAPGLTDYFLELSGWQRSRVILEITEESAISNYDLFLMAVEHYRNQGYRIAIDDFGSGYAGLKMFSRVRPDFLKIDREFISFIDTNPVNHKIVESISRLCQQLNVICIAEGVERIEEKEVLHSCGIELAQGFLFGRPQL